MVILVVFGDPLINFLFEHGKFDSSAGDLTYTAVLGYVFALPAYAATEIASRSLLALRDARTPFLANLGQLGLRFGLTAAFIGPLGLIGIPLAAAAAGNRDGGPARHPVAKAASRQPYDFLRIHPRPRSVYKVGTQLGPFGLSKWATVAYVRSFLSDRSLDEHGFGWQHERIRNRLPRLWTIRVHRLVARDRPWRARLLRRLRIPRSCPSPLWVVRPIHGIDQATWIVGSSGPSKRSTASRDERRSG